MCCPQNPILNGERGDLAALRDLCREHGAASASSHDGEQKLSSVSWPISASTASRMAAPAAGGGTYSTVAVAPVPAVASATLAKTGRARCISPAFLGLTPPTICVPYAIACSQWKVPVFPVNPWQMTFVCLKTAGGGGFACGTRGNRQSGWKGAGERSERDLAHGGWASVGARSHNTHLRREASTQHRSHAARGTVGQHWPA